MRVHSNSVVLVSITYTVCYPLVCSLVIALQHSVLVLFWAHRLLVQMYLPTKLSATAGELQEAKIETSTPTCPTAPVHFCLIWSFGRLSIKDDVSKMSTPVADSVAYICGFAVSLTLSAGSRVDMAPKVCNPRTFQTPC